MTLTAHAAEGPRIARDGRGAGAHAAPGLPGSASAIAALGAVSVLGVSGLLWARARARTDIYSVCASDPEAAGSTPLHRCRRSCSLSSQCAAGDGTDVLGATAAPVAGTGAVLMLFGGAAVAATGAVRASPQLYPLCLIAWVGAGAALLHRRRALPRRIPPELLSFLAMSAWASLAPNAAAPASLPVPAPVNVAFEWLLPASLALSLLPQAPAPGARPPAPHAPRLPAMAVSFGLGVAGTVLGTLLTGVAMHALRLSVPPRYMAAGLACLTASYVGGTINFFETVRLIPTAPEGLQYVTLLAGADIVVMSLYFFAIGGLQRLFSERRRGPDERATAAAPAQAVPPARPLPDAALLVGSGVLGLGFAGLGTLFGRVLPLTSVPLVLMVCAAYGCGRALKAAVPGREHARLFGAVRFAREITMCMFFAALGACATLPELRRLGPIAVGSMTAVLAIHLAVMFAGRWLWNRYSRHRIDTDTLLVASNACAGGSATAASMAEGIQRPDLTLPATIVGILGYILGTRLGLGMYHVLLAAVGVAWDPSLVV